MGRIIRPHHDPIDADLPREAAQGVGSEDQRIKVKLLLPVQKLRHSGITARAIMRAAVVLMSLVFVAGCTVAPSETSDSRPAQVPVFEVDAAWPKVPDEWRLGDASSIGIDTNDNV